jgi:tRNA threonylcarbamoyl adenosine modification protein (Sua5/YciO/YrdC/YwlC family)
MPPVVIDIRSADDSRDVVHRAVQALVEGRLVVFPTETVYGVAASARNEAAIERLLNVKNRRTGQALTLAVRSADDALDYVPDMCPLAQRLARRCWPGPVTLVLEDRHPESLLERLPPGARRAVTPQRSVGLRVPAHQTILDVLRLLAGPLGGSSANRAGQPEALTADKVLEALGDDVDLILDDGPSRFGQPSSVVRVSEKGVEILRAGVVSELTLRRLSSLMVLFVCTGNTCRSPMAEALCRRMVAERLGCASEEVEERGVIVMSAGIAAMVGGAASPEAVHVMAEMGLKLDDHESRPLTDQLVRHADIIYTMTRSHRQAILAQWPGAAQRTRLLASDETDIADPIGGPSEQYRRSAAQIKAALENRVRELEL